MTLTTLPLHTKTKLPLIIMLYFIFLIITIPFSQDISRSWNVFYNKILKLSFMALFICAFVRSPNHLILFISMYLLAFMKIGQEEFVGKITGSLVWENQGILRLWGPQNSIYGHPSSLSGVSIITLPFIYYYFTIVHWRWRLFLIIQLIFVVNIAVFTGSRTGYFAILIMTIFTLIRSDNKKLFISILLLLSLFAIPLIPHDYIERFETIYSGTEREGHSKDARKELMADSFKIFLENPFGVGIGAFRTVRNNSLGKVPMDTHCLYTEILSETGFIGLLIFLLLLYHLFSELNSLSSKLDKDLKALTLYMTRLPKNSAPPSSFVTHLFHMKFMKATSDALIIFLIARLALGVFGHDLYEIYWWFAAGLTIALSNIYSAANRHTHQLFLSYSEL